MRLRAAIRDAIYCGPVPKLRKVEDMIADPQSTGEQVIAFAAHHLVVPTGMKRGEPLILTDFQCAFILSVFDNPVHTKEAIFSIAARNGKTFLIAVILLAYLIGPLAEANINVASGAMSRDQAGLCFTLMHKILMASPECEGHWDAVPSGKRIVGLRKNTEYVALSADAKTGYGKDLKVILLDEAGQIQGPRSDFSDMLESRQGSHDDALFIIVSTQGRSDADYLSLAIDNARREKDPQTVCHVYTAEKYGEDGKKVFIDLEDKRAWKRANPGLGIFRSVPDLEKQIRKAVQIPVKEPAARNQFLNERIAMEQLAISPTVWRSCQGDIDLEVFRGNKVTMGLDLSARNDLTAAVLCAEDDDSVVHTLPFVFCPTSGIEERARRDRAPYDLWVRGGDMIPVGGKTMDFDQIADALNSELTDLNIVVAEIHYDKAMMTHFQAACERVSAFQECEWIGVPQFFKDMGKRLDSLTGLMAEGQLKHGGHPVLAMAASVAVAKVGREGISALAKNLSTQRIDPLVALVMAAWPFGDGRDNVPERDVALWVA